MTPGEIDPKDSKFMGNEGCGAEEVAEPPSAAARDDALMRIGTRETVRRIAIVLNRRKPFSLVRLGDGEMRAIRAMKAGRMPQAWIESDNISDLAPKRAAAYLEIFREGLLATDVLGLPYAMGSGQYLQPLIHELGSLVHLATKDVCDTAVPNFLVVGGQLWGLLAGRRILIMNDQPAAITEAVAAGRYSEQFLHYGIDRYPPWDIVGAVRTDSAVWPGDEQYQSAEPAPEWHEPAHYVEQAAAHDFDVALVAFGWRSTILCPMLAERTGKVVLDMGQVLREMWLERPNWRSGHSWGGFEDRAAEALAREESR